MKVFFTQLLVTFFSVASIAQTIDFTHANPQPELIDTYGGSFASGDIDGDGDNDLLIGGGSLPAAALYLNDGFGGFSEVQNNPLSLENVFFTHVQFADLDGDGDLDLFFAGTASGIHFTHIYLNDGQGEFTLTSNPSLLELKVVSFAIGDVDGDEDLDLLIAGFNADEDDLVDIYLNDGNANFSSEGYTAFTSGIGAPVQWYDAAEFMDAENDGDTDVILCGSTDPDNSPFVILYLNDGSGNYSVNTSAGFAQISGGDLDASDIDNDGDIDILISGMDSLFEVRTLLYTNDGDGLFTEMSTPGLQETFAGKNAIADLDNDGDQDILITGSQDGGLPNIYNILYENLGNNEFIPVDTIGGEYISNCLIGDFTGDGLKDIIIQGFVDKTNIYWNTTILSSISNQVITEQLSVYPNPSNGKFHIQSMDNLSSSIKIYNTNGELVFLDNDLNTNSPIRLNQSPGLYMVIIKTNHSTSTHKLILK